MQRAYLQNPLHVQPRSQGLMLLRVGRREIPGYEVAAHKHTSDAIELIFFGTVHHS